MNSVIMSGRLTDDPKIKETTQTKIASYTLAVERRKTAENGQREADFISVKAFSKSADFAQNYLHKGMKIIVRGRIQTGKYQKQDGTTVYTTDVVADEQEFCEKKAENEQHAAETGRKPDDFMPTVDAVDDPGLPFH